MFPANELRDNRTVPLSHKSQWDSPDDQLSIQKGYMHMYNKRHK